MGFVEEEKEAVEGKEAEQGVGSVEKVQEVEVKGVGQRAELILTEEEEV